MTQVSIIGHDCVCSGSSRFVHRPRFRGQIETLIHKSFINLFCQIQDQG